MKNNKVRLGDIIKYEAGGGFREPEVVGVSVDGRELCLLDGSYIKKWSIESLSHENRVIKKGSLSNFIRHNVANILTRWSEKIRKYNNGNK